MRHLDFIKADKINNYFLKIKYLGLWSFNDKFKNVKKLEIRINGINKNIENLNEVAKISIQKKHYYIGRGRGRGRGLGGRLGRIFNERIEEIKLNTILIIENTFNILITFLNYI